MTQLLIWGNPKDKTADVKKIENLFTVRYSPSETTRGGGLILTLMRAPIEDSIIMATSFVLPHPKKDFPKPFADIQSWKQAWDSYVIPTYKQSGAFLGRIGKGSIREYGRKHFNSGYNPISTHARLGFNGTPKWISKEVMKLIHNDSVFHHYLEMLVPFNRGEDIAFGLLLKPYCFLGKPAVCLIDNVKSRKGTSHLMKHSLDKTVQDIERKQLGSIIDSFYKEKSYSSPVSGYKLMLSRVVSGGLNKESR